MSEREDEHFDIDDEFLGEAEESHDFDPLIERTERRPKAAAAGKRGKAAWSRVEDVLAERMLEKELRDIHNPLGRLMPLVRGIEFTCASRFRASR
jgi:hypothetical protein